MANTPQTTDNLTPQERQAIADAINETALAINDRVNATTAQERLAALNRYNNGMRDLLYAFANVLRAGTQGGYSP